jgi:hypothetical protein
MFLANQQRGGFCRLKKGGMFRSYTARARGRSGAGFSLWTRAAARTGKIDLVVRNE